MRDLPDYRLEQGNTDNPYEGEEEYWLDVEAFYEDSGEVNA